MGTRSLSGILVTARLAATVQNELTDGSVASIGHPSISYSASLEDGVGDSEANRAIQLSGTLSEHQAQITIDLRSMTGIDAGAGSGLDGLGQTVLFENIVAILIANDNDVDADGMLEIFPASSKGWTPIGSHTQANGGYLSGGGVLMKVSPHEGGFDIVSGSSYRLTLRAYGGSVDYGIYILARHDDEASSSSSSSSVSSASSSSSLSSISTSSASSSISTSSISTSSISTSSISSESSSSSSSSSSSGTSSESSSSGSSSSSSSHSSSSVS